MVLRNGTRISFLWPGGPVRQALAWSLMAAGLGTMISGVLTGSLVIFLAGCLVCSSSWFWYDWEEAQRLQNRDSRMMPPDVQISYLTAWRYGDLDIWFDRTSRREYYLVEDDDDDDDD